MGVRVERHRSVRGRLLILLSAIALVGSLAAVPTASAEVLMAAGDVACDNGGSASPGDCSHLYTANLALAQKNSPEGLDALLAIGDLQYEDGTLAEFRNGFGPTWGRPELRSVLRPVPGNHEYQTAGAAGYFDYFASIGVGVGARGQGWYSFDVGSWHIVALNSSNGCKPVSCAAGSAQEQWLRNDLASTPNKQCTIAFWHHPLGSASAERPIWQVLYDQGVDFVLVGHNHGYDRGGRQDPNGNPDSNGPWEKTVGTGGKSGSAYGLLKFTLRPGAADYRFVGSGASDSGSVTCSGASPTPPPPPPPPPPPAKPTADFTVSTSGLTASFTDASKGSPDAWLWDLGDGTQVGSTDPADDQIRNPTHTYAKAGSYTVKLTARNAGGTHTVTKQVTVTAAASPPPPPPSPPPSGADTVGTPSPVAPPVLPNVTPPSPPVMPASSVTTTSATLSLSTARAAVRRVAKLRLRKWKVTKLHCKSTGPLQAACSFRATRGKRRVLATGSLTLPAAGGAVSFRLKVRISGDSRRRTTTWNGRTRP
jgi:PKD repeat protein